MDSINIKVAQEFSPTPGPRYKKEGKYSGEEFRQNILFPKVKEAFDKNIKIIVDLDGTAGYGTSFLEEAFGGLIRVDRLTLSDILDHLELRSTEEEYLVEDVHEYLKDADEESKKVYS